MKIPFLHWSRSCGALAGLALLCGTGGAFLRDWISQEGFRDAQGKTATSPGMGGCIPGEIPAAIAEPIAAVYDGVFRATVYYTPLESGFSAAGGFDMTPTTRAGLKGKSFPKDFLKAVEMEGFGRMKSPVAGKWYVSCCRGRWDYADRPLDAGGQPLRALRSTAVSSDYQLIRAQANFRVRAEGLPAAFMGARWEICDTGGGLEPGQIDFYWGEDVPLGPGKRLGRPQGLPHPIVNPIVLVLR